MLIICWSPGSRLNKQVGDVLPDQGVKINTISAAKVTTNAKWTRNVLRGMTNLTWYREIASFT